MGKKVILNTAQLKALTKSQLHLYFERHAQYYRFNPPTGRYGILVGNRHVFSDDTADLFDKFTKAVKAVKPISLPHITDWSGKCSRCHKKVRNRDADCPTRMQPVRTGVKKAKAYA